MGIVTKDENNERERGEEKQYAELFAFAASFLLCISLTICRDPQYLFELDTTPGVA